MFYYIIEYSGTMFLSLKNVLVLLRIRLDIVMVG